MKEIKLYCDICGKEFPPQEYSFLTGQIIKVNAELKAELLKFEGHYCGEDTKKLLTYIENLTNELKNAEHTNTSEISDQSDKE